jgi:hypothetical protein
VTRARITLRGAVPAETWIGLLAGLATVEAWETLPEPSETHTAPNLRPATAAAPPDPYNEPDPLKSTGYQIGDGFRAKMSETPGERPVENEKYSVNPLGETLYAVQLGLSGRLYVWDFARGQLTVLGE